MQLRYRDQMLLGSASKGKQIRLTSLPCVPSSTIALRDVEGASENSESITNYTTRRTSYPDPYYTVSNIVVERQD